jgi:aryl-alcohol dehydrogenase-like predicted oxidoreductase
VALAWVYSREAQLGVPVVPIPGTRDVARLEENVAALQVDLTAEDLAVLDPLADQVVGSRY